MSRIEIVIDLDLCGGAGLCVENCPNQVLGLENGKGFVIDSVLCGECYYCESICPNDAIRVRRIE